MIKNKNTHTIKINPRRTVMKILFYDTKSYDKESFEATLKNFPASRLITSGRIWIPVLLLWLTASMPSVLSSAPM